jgi:hypothetical protein
MAKLSPNDRFPKSKQYRTVTFLFGLFFLILAIAILILSGPSTRIGSIFVALILAGLGLDALISALRQKPSFLSRIGPLP